MDNTMFKLVKLSTTMEDLALSETPLANLLGATDVDLDPYTLYHIQKNVSRLSREIQNYKVLLSRLVRKFGVKCDDSNNWEVDMYDEEKWSAYVKAHAELLAVVVEIELYELPADLPNRCRLSIGDKAALSFMFVNIARE